MFHPLIHRLTWPLLLLFAGCGKPDWSPTIDDPSHAIASHIAKGECEAGPLGDQVHSLLYSNAKVVVEAEWSPMASGADSAKIYDVDYPLLVAGARPPRFATAKSEFPLMDYAPIHSLAPAQQRRTYTSQEFSVFLPDGDLTDVGMTWPLDLAGVARFLTQFHPAVSMHLDATGRRPGPNGAFGILQSVSATHAEVAFRVHAEFEPEVKEEIGVHVTPGCFLGHMLINTLKGKVEYFHLAVPQEDTLNLSLTVVLPSEAMLDLVHVDQMELKGGSRPAPLEWSQSISDEEAERKLRRLFFPFAAIHWAPPQQAVELAQESGKPILAVVMWGNFDDQSC